VFEILDILHVLLILARQLLISGIDISDIVSGIISIIEIIIQDRFLLRVVGSR
jgi:hypothetical protein